MGYYVIIKDNQVVFESDDLEEIREYYYTMEDTDKAFIYKRG